jgi:uncharacterized membrane protein
MASSKNPQITNYTGVDMTTGTATSTAATVTLGTSVGFITTEALTTAAQATYTFTLVNPLIKVGTYIGVTAGLGTSTQGVPTFETALCTAGQAVITIQNDAASLAFNGTITISYLLFNAS